MSMAYRPTLWSKSGVLLFSVVLAGGVVNLLFTTPNNVYGGEAMIFGIIILAIVFKVVIEFVLTRWQNRRDEKRDDKPGV